MKSHLSKSKPFAGAGPEGDDLETSEYWCQECSNRVTKSSSTGREYGHTRDCDHHLRGSQEAAAP